MYRLNEEIYPVSGAAKDCLYDLKQRKLWHIGKDTAALIRRCVTEQAPVLTADEAEALRKLTEAGLLTAGCAEIPDIRKLRREPKIVSAWIEVCSICNLCCIHCYNGEQPQISMSVQDFRTVCEKLAAYGIRSVRLIGGEPLCHPEIRTLLQIAADTFDAVSIYTNGTLLTEKLCALMQQLRITAALSVYSYDSAMHDAVTGSAGSHQKTEHGIRLLRAYGIPFRTAAVRMKGIRIGAPCGKPYSLEDRPDIVRLSGRGSLALLDAALLREKLITADTFRKPLNPSRVTDAVSGNPCFSKKVCIAADLNVYPCIMEHRLRHGNLRCGSLEENLSPAVMQMNKDSVSGCRDCEFRYACPDCLPDSLSQQPDTKPYSCTYDEQRGEWTDPDARIAALLGQSD